MGVSMRSTILLSLALALAGCGGDLAEDNHGYGWAYDLEGATGLRLRYSAALPPQDPSFVQQYEEAFAIIQACAGMTAPPPFIILVPLDSLPPQPDGTEVRGRYYLNPSLLVVEGSGTGHTSTVRHEAKHHVLFSATGDADPFHRHPLFDPLSPC